ncbi:MAG: UDP-N-acetylglucosamine 1-carboxyvinyltransferase [Saprospiraceae bacterium]|jgi:UDP-N-acetylglucosamine 1-carboxyvinyltransferase|nr:UDP-N-acetylglucosamine 1-carboxyvinyltransferase [Saprospiraceae bacterium]MBV6472327.1 UDP-N-acetylglucosamine 1-carboxyvinyltransferase [Saprospiraceae bacterium]
MAVNDAFEVTGGKTLSGELHPQGAKNEALQILCATLLTSEAVTIRNLPDILDIRHLIQLLGGLGVKVTRHDAHSYTFEAREVDLEYFGTEAFQDNARKIRGSVMLLAPLLARYKKAVLPKPGGDKIGRRRLDTHFLGLQKLGARFQYDEGSNRYEISAERLEGAYILMDEISVTGTANVLMAAVLARGETTIYNAACEPYIQQLCAMLCRMGARIEGIGSNLLHVHGVERLGGTEHTILPDMIEIGSFISLAAMTQSTLTIKNAGVSQLGIIPTVFERLGARIDVRGDDLHIPAQEEYAIQSFLDGSIMTIYDSPWPGFSPDLMSVLLVMAIQAKGAVLLHQKMFESRLFFVDKLIDMGAQIILCDPHRATVIGHNRRFALRGIEMTSPDIRAGVALLIAALSARGTSRIHAIHQIDRGYEHIDQRLQAVGAQIIRT